jgi:hypothetical protein
MKKEYLFVFLFLMVVISAILIDNNNKSPEKVIENLYNAIGVAEQNGNYKCCIEPACTMCYLGHWKFEKGTCHCDEAIAEGRLDDVCPECKSGIEKGFCKSTTNDCILDEEVYGGK